MGYRIASFNLRNFGDSALLKNNPRDIETMARIIKEEDFDIVAFQEILSEGRGFTFEGNDNFKKGLLGYLGPNEWEFIYADTESEDRRTEYYGFLWKKNKFERAKKLEDGSLGYAFTDLCRLKRNLLRRAPFYLRLTPINGPFIEIRLLCIHTSFDNKEMRKQELDVLLKEIYPSIEDRRYGNNRPSYTILLGDYNAVVYNPNNIYGSDVMYIGDQQGIVYTKEGRRIITVQSQKTSLKKSFQEGEDPYSRDYDHFSYDFDKMIGVAGKAQRVEAVRKYTDNDFETYRNTISDHIPIVMEINLK